MTQFKVLNRKDAESYSCNPTVKSYAVISINEHNEVNNKANIVNSDALKDILYLFFDDVDRPDPHCMTKEHAEAIKEFVIRWMDEVELIIVHCQGGVSRSAGVCAGILKSLYNNDTQIFNNARYCPNMTCYRLVVEEFLNYYDEVEAEVKINHNIEIWRKEWLDD